VTTANPVSLRSRLYEAYTTQHAGSGGGHIRDGDFTHQTSFTACSIHQLAVADHIVTQNLTFAARKRAVPVKPAEN
jgi:hypothetical protein